MTLKDSSRTIEHIDQIMNSLENISSEIKEKNDSVVPIKIFRSRSDSKQVMAGRDRNYEQN